MGRGQQTAMSAHKGAFESKNCEKTLDMGALENKQGARPY